jgi:hypothetical protein
MELYKKIIVINWINNNEFKQYEIFVYEDDNLDDASSKIAKTINTTSRFYVWKSNKSILFNCKTIQWDGYSVNPIKATNLQSKKLKDPVIYIFNYGLFTYSSINIIFEDDFPELKNNPYYFTDKTFQNLSQLKKKEQILKTLETIDIKPIIDTTLNIHRYELESKLTKQYQLVDIFEKLNTSPIIEFIQWINDTYKILYKLHKVNKLSQDKFINWTDIKKITSSNCINCFSILNNGTYAKLTIKQDMSITLSYTINLRKNIIWKEINDNIKAIINYCNSHLNHKLTFQEISIKSNFIIEIENVSMQNLKKRISEYIDIFEILKSNKDTINLIYKRSSNYNKQGFDAHVYVKNCLYLGIEEDDIINQLIILNNLDNKDAIQLLKEEKEFMFEMEQQNIKQQETMNKINTIVIIELYKNGFYINIINIPNKKELENIIYWLSKIIANSVQKPTKIKTNAKKQIIQSINQPISSSSNKMDSDEEELGKLPFNSSSSNSISDKSGGALGKDKHSYFINLLQKADKDLFLNNYARTKCQAINQPVVFSQEYKETLQKDGNYHVDNDIIYGSKEDIKNVYTCPRLWCPQSKIPLNADSPNQMCPIDGEEPMELFFDDDPKKKRYVKLIKPDENNLCVPCCFKKQPKDEELNKCKFYNNKKPEEIIINDEDKDDNYLVNTSPIKVGRYGAIPQSLHELLFPNIKFSLCSKMLNKTDKCFVRRGIVHKTTKKIKNIHNDSIISAIANGLDFKSKEQFVSNLTKKLDLIKFISLENGNVCKAFMDKLPVIAENNKSLILELQLHLDTFNLNKIITINDTDKANYKLSRLLGIFKSYKKFITYIRSNDYPTGKSPYYLYSLISNIYNVLLVIWEKQSDTTSILCPYYTSFEDLIGSMELNGKILMLLKDKYYYEPIELKIKGVDGDKLIPLNEYKHIKRLFSECSILKHTYDDNYTIFNNIYSLHSWIKTSILGMKEKFIIAKIVINNDLSITHFITNGGFFIIIDKISISFLPRLIIDLEITELIFYDDIIGNEININILIRDFTIFSDKCKILHISYNFGDITLETPKEYYYSLIIQKLPLTNDIIHSQIIDDLYKYQLINSDNNKKWYQLQFMIYLRIINLTDTVFNNLLSLHRNDRITQLFKLLKLDKNVEKSKLRVILEEIPFISKNYIKKFLNDFIIYYKYDFLNPLIKEDKSQFIFSQVALQHTIPSKLLVYHPTTPNNTFTTFTTKDYIYNLQNNEPEEVLPNIFTGTQEKLNSKWVMHKKSKWSNMIYIKNLNYNKNFIKDFYLWLAKLLNIKTTYSDLETSAFNDIQTIFTAKDYNSVKSLLKDLFDDSYFNKLICNAIGKTYNNFNLFWDKYYSIISINDRKELLNTIITNIKIPLFPNDYYILGMSKILNINIILIHRSKYGTINKENPIIRGDMEDLLLSSTFYKAPTSNYENRPVIILYKNDDDIKTIYSLIVDRTIIPVNEKSIYIKLNDIPLAIKYLIEQHLKLIK